MRILEAAKLRFSTRDTRTKCILFAWLLYDAIASLSLLHDFKRAHAHVECQSGINRGVATIYSKLVMRSTLSAPSLSRFSRFAMSVSYITERPKCRNPIGCLQLARNGAARRPKQLLCHHRPFPVSHRNFLQQRTTDTFPERCLFTVRGNRFESGVVCMLTVHRSLLRLFIEVCSAAFTEDYSLVDDARMPIPFGDTIFSKVTAEKLQPTWNNVVTDDDAVARRIIVRTVLLPASNVRFRSSAIAENPRSLKGWMTTSLHPFSTTVPSSNIRR